LVAIWGRKGKTTGISAAGISTAIRVPAELSYRAGSGERLQNILGRFCSY
jgi:hypothetical protein